ncbi:hypothetical protein CPC08DRAFT_727636 [Agrocybe pediades]|nr:hypothetical protein CPC08DRAFT_727636 [Agrocybe pediades]
MYLINRYLAGSREQGEVKMRCWVFRLVNKRDTVERSSERTRYLQMIKDVEEVPAEISQTTLENAKDKANEDSSKVNTIKNSYCLGDGCEGPYPPLTVSPTFTIKKGSWNFSNALSHTYDLPVLSAPIAILGSERAVEVDGRDGKQKFSRFPLEKEEEDAEDDKPFGSHRHIPRVEDSVPSSAAKVEEQKQSISKRNEQRKQFSVQDGLPTIRLWEFFLGQGGDDLQEEADEDVRGRHTRFDNDEKIHRTLSSRLAVPRHHPPNIVLPALYLIVCLVLRDSLSWFRREVWVQMGGFSGGGGGLYDDAG